jgi:hypothetical protein
VIELMVMPILAQIDLFLKMTKRATRNAKGGPKMIENPPRIPSKVPHPKPGTLRICAPTKIQGVSARAKLIFPRNVDFSPLSSVVCNLAFISCFVSSLVYPQSSIVTPRPSSKIPSGDGLGFFLRKIKILYCTFNLTLLKPS